MRCEQSHPLVPLYLDGELSEELAGPLRQHLLECPACRARVQEHKTLSSWFVPTAEVHPSAGFAERVARRAFAGGAPGGDSGERDVVLTPPGGGGVDPSRTTRFPMHLTAAAAILLVGLTVVLAGRGRAPAGAGGGLEAAPTVDQALQELDALNAAEGEVVQPPGDVAGRDDEDGDAEEQEDE